jgi:hypothetical protein
MNVHDELLNRLNLLEYHQRLILKMLTEPRHEFDKLIIENGISEQEVQTFFQLCDDLSIKMEEQKAEGFVYFHPLFNKFSSCLPAKLNVREVIQSCLRQNLYEPLFTEFKKYL